MIKIDKQAYIKLIEEDLDYLNQHCKEESLELDHIKAVLCFSIDLLYPEPQPSAKNINP
ncbi:hypothetical protein [uncultured Rikenella sp.]|uniref:hypothetical protein n=1 Tax=uncultured Rikenella sp. TaxID=368003 RepID=UPI00260D6668|nr:hypothetical protein [uncultured Rikenella sp.]